MNQSIPFVLQFRQQLGSVNTDNGEQYQVDILASPRGGKTAPAILSGLSPALMRSLRTQFHAFVVRHQANEDVIDEGLLDPIRIIGKQLFKSLPEEIRNELQLAQQIALDKQKVLSIKLIFDQTAEALMELPWELLHDPDSGRFFALQGGGVSRSLQLPTTSKRRVETKPQAILGVWCAPQNIEPLADRGQNKGLGKDTKATWIEGKETLTQLKNALDLGGFDALHIVAHGRPNDAAEFALAFANAQNQPHWLSPDQFATFIAQYPEIRFIFLEVCGSGSQTAVNDDSLNVSPGGIANYLVRVGIPTVIVMQDRIAQDASGVITHAFYNALEQGKTIPHALTQGRRTIRIEKDDPLHWSIPVLYQQHPLKNSQLLEKIDHGFDKFVFTTTIFDTFVLLLLLIIIGHVSHGLAQVHLDRWSSWKNLGLPLLTSAFIPILIGVLSWRGQDELAERLKIHGGDWLPILVNKYFTAFLWSILNGWSMVWLIWIAVFGAGIGQNFSIPARQLIWFAGLLLIAVASFGGTRQALRQSRNFLPIKFTIWGKNLFTLFIFITMPIVTSIGIPTTILIFVWGLKQIWPNFLTSPLYWMIGLVSLIISISFFHISFTRGKEANPWL